MTSLVDFLTFTKGVEYLLAIAFLIGSGAFWQVIHSRSKGIGIGTVLLLYIMIGAVLVVVNYITSAS